MKHPFRFLLYLEWLLLSLALLGSLGYGFVRGVERPLLAPITILVFGISGLYFPQRQRYKILSTMIEIGCIVLASTSGNRFFPFLYLILTIRGCLRFQLPGRSIVSAIAYGLFLLFLGYRLWSLSVMPVSPGVRARMWLLAPNFALTFGLSLGFVLLMMNALLAERQRREELAIAHQQLRQYALRVQDQATLQERNRIARDIHDSLGHALTGLNLQLEAALKLWDSNPHKARLLLENAKNLGSEALTEVRHSVSTLREDPLEGRSLSTALNALAEQFQRSSGMEIILELSDRPLPQRLRSVCYRIVQESLTNAAKHAAASVVRVELTTSSQCAIVSICDNGRGFSPEQNLAGFGLKGMRERAIAAHGELFIDSEPGKGCQIRARFPPIGIEATG